MPFDRADLPDPPEGEAVDTHPMLHLLTQGLPLESEACQWREMPALLAAQDRCLLDEANDGGYAADQAMAIMAAYYPINTLMPGVFTSPMHN